MDPIGVVTNPHSRKNRRDPRRLDRLRRIVGDHGVVVQTRSVDELPTTLARMLGQGVTHFVADGGDGALHWMWNELRSLVDEVPPVTPTNGGTIDFVAKKVALHGNAESIVEAATTLARERGPLDVVPIDSLEITGERSDGAAFKKVAFALAAGGVGQRFFDKYYAEPDPGTGTIVKVVAQTVGSHALGALPVPVPERWLRYGREVFRPTAARVTIDGVALPHTEHRAIHAGAFDVNLGGIFRVFPLARAPGRLHFMAGPVTAWDAIRNLPNMFRGREIDSPRITERAGDEMVIEALGPEDLAPVMDGELYVGLRRLVVRRGPVVRIGRVHARRR